MKFVRKTKTFWPSYKLILKSIIDTNKMLFEVLRAPKTVYSKDNEIASKYSQD